MTRRTRSSSSSTSSTNKFDVFEFNEDAERVEHDSKRMLAKFTNPRKPRYSSLTKYDFLRYFAHGDVTASKIVTVDPIVLSESDDEEVKCSPEKPRDEPLEVADGDDDGGGRGGGGAGRDDRGTCDVSCSIDVPLQDSADEVTPGITGFVDGDIDLKNQLLSIDSEDDDSSQISSSSTSTVDTSEAEVSLEDKLVGHGSTACEIDDIKKVVDIYPDFIKYGEDLYSTSSRLIFSCSSLKVEGSAINGTKGTFKIEWETEDIIKIESCWFGKVETAMINLLFKSKDSEEAGNTNKNSGFELLKFAVYDPCWAKTEQSIKLLDMRYADLWTTIYDIDTDNNTNISLGQNSCFSQKHYFPISDEAFDEVIFPKGEPDAVSLSKRDVELLRPETFINDTIIDFYIKYLKNKIPPDEQDRFHFFNCFFFRKLTDLDRNPSSACDGKAAFQRVRKWTRKVNLFEKDYIFIPVNYSLHWSLIVICHPGEVFSFKDEDIKESSKVPCILHMDSLKGSHRGLRNVFQSYFGEEWKERHNNVEDEVFSKFLHMRFISLELPQQENLYDCGLFLLHYVECFLTEAPINFNPFKIAKFSNFLQSNWFPPPEASLKRFHIQKLIYDIFDDNSLKAPADCLDKVPPTEVRGIIKHKVEAGSFSENCSPAAWPGRNPSSSCTKQETDIQFTAVSPVRAASCLKEPGFAYKDFQRVAEESGEETAALEIEDPQVALLTSDFPSTSYIRKDHKVSETSPQGFSVNLAETIEGHRYSRTSGACYNPFETKAHEEQPLKKTEMSNISEKTDVLEYLSTSSEELADSFVQDSQEENDGGYDVNERVRSHSLFQGNMKSVTGQILDLTQNMSHGDDLVSKEEPLASECDEPDAKRPKVMNAGHQKRQFTRSMSKKRCLMSCK